MNIPSHNSAKPRHNASPDRYDRQPYSHNRLFVHGRYGGYPSRPNDHSMLQHHKCNPLDCRQLPLNNRYSEGVVMTSKGTATIYTLISHTEIRSHMKILFHQDSKDQHIKVRASKEISGFIGFRRRNPQRGIPPNREIVHYLDSISVNPETFSSPSTFYDLVDRIRNTIAQTHAQLPLRRDFRPGTKHTSWKHSLTYEEQKMVNDPSTKKLVPVRSRFGNHQKSLLSKKMFLVHNCYRLTTKYHVNKSTYQLKLRIRALMTKKTQRKTLLSNYLLMKNCFHHLTKKKEYFS